VAADVNVKQRSRKSRAEHRIGIFNDLGRGGMNGRDSRTKVV
jgi:hypothetical protein